jgi:hypothetical protein
LPSREHCGIPVTGAIGGVRNAKQVDGILDASTFRLMPDEIKKIESEE